MLSSQAVIIIKSKRDAPFRKRHPWVFSGAIDSIKGSPKPGSEVAVVTDRGDFIAWGLFNPNSQISVRLYSWQENEHVTDSFIRSRLISAISFRKSVPSLFSNGKNEAARLFFSESDGLSGLTVDYYAGFIGIQLTSLALSFKLDTIINILQDLINPRGIYLRTEKGIRELEGLEISDSFLKGTAPGEPVVIKDNNIEYEVNLTEGHKTGFYLDQRENRKRVAEFAINRKCLDVCCYTGGFSLNLMKGGAKSVLGIDASATAVETAIRNARINEITNAEFTKGDAFSMLENKASQKEMFDLIVLDPPRFAQKTKGLSQALKGYAGLNGLAVRLLSPGGILVSCSCSGRVSRVEFTGMLAEVAQITGRGIRIIEERGAAIDHPVNPACPESDYLKCFICSVE